MSRGCLGVVLACVCQLIGAAHAIPLKWISVVVLLNIIDYLLRGCSLYTTQLSLLLVLNVRLCIVLLGVKFACMRRDPLSTLVCSFLCNGGSVTRVLGVGIPSCIEITVQSYG